MATIAAPRPDHPACPPGGDRLCPHRQRLILDHGGLAACLAGIYSRRHALPHHAADDVAASAGMGLTDAARLYDFDAGVKFITYAPGRILGQIIDDRRRDRLLGPSGRHPHRPRLLVQRLDARVKGNRSGSAGNGTDGDGEARQAFSALLPGRVDPPHRACDDAADFLRAIRCLPRVHREAVRLYYLDGLPMAEVGRRLGRCEARVSQIIHASHDMIREARGC